MKKLLPLIFLWAVVACSPIKSKEGITTDLRDRWDTIRPLANPGKGWYHHLLDNGIDKYQISDDSVFMTFPGMDHLYLRLAWAYLEPEEGRYDWSHIDTVVEKYIPLGYGISFRITCKETGPAPGSVPREIDGIRYATPYWVKEAGAKGIDRPGHGSPSWTPQWNDPVFLEKLDNFHKAFAERYDGKPWVRYIDVGSIGEWGEGHTHFSTRIPPTADEVKTHMQLHLKHYKNTTLVVTDDLLYWNKPTDEVQELLEFALSNGFSLRDDSPLVDWYIDNNLDTWSVSHPHFFEDVYPTRPVVFELQHYGHVKKDGNWKGRNGEEILQAYGVSGAEIFRNAMQLIRPTYIGYHGYAEEWLNDNPQLTNELLNLCGYWYFPVSFKISEIKNMKLAFSINWLNKGVAPAYDTFTLKGKLIPLDSLKNPIHFELDDSGNRKWKPGEVVVTDYITTFSERPEGNYKLGIQLFDLASGKPVEIGVKPEAMEEGYFILDRISF